MSKVRAGQQRQGGSENDLEAKVRNTGGKKKGKEKRSQKQIRKDKYAKLIGQTKAKPVVDRYGFMTSCHCRGRGTCSCCIQRRNGTGISQAAGAIKYYADGIKYYEDGTGHRYTTPGLGRYPVYSWQ